jgi:hypothetical protein
MAKVSGTSSKVSSGGMWAGDAHGMNKMTGGSASKVTSTKDSGSMAKVSGTSSKVSSGGMWAGDAHGMNKMTTQKTSMITSVKGSSVSFKEHSSSKLTGSTSSKTIVSSTKTSVAVKESSSTSLKASASFDYSCSCEDSFEINICVPTPSPINPLAPEPSVPLDSIPPTAPETIELNEIECVDDVAMTSTGVAVEIPVLDNDGSIPNGKC